MTHQPLYVAIGVIWLLIGAATIYLIILRHKIAKIRAEAREIRSQIRSGNQK